LKGGNAFLRSHHQMRSGKPLVQRYLAALVQRADRDGEGLAAGVALVKARTVGFALHLGRFGHNATMRADWAFRPKPRFKPHTGLVVIVENGVRKVAHGYSLKSEGILRHVVYYVKVIIPPTRG